MASGSSCCGTNGKTSESSCCDMESKSVQAAGAKTHEEVREFYGKAGAQPQAGLCCPTSYKPEDIAHIPQDVLAVSYGCGSPVLMAGLAAGEVHVDLGSGGGIDCFIASKLVGKTGRVIGVDMTPEMMMKAIQNSNKVSKNLGYHNVEFRHGVMEDVPVDSETADLVTSNCVINLSPDKKKVFQEVHRILKHNGRFVISDIVSDRPVPQELQNDKKLWGECISGALTESEFLQFAKDEGFYGLQVKQRTFFKEEQGYRFSSVTLQGWKFKKGPSCVYIGQYATYLGPYSEVTDDENHTFQRGVPFEVCTDTAIKLTKPPYAGSFEVTDPTKEIDQAEGCCNPEPSNGGTKCC